ncbi:MAG: TolC family protein [Methylococcaceae bacterium]|nr:TolC family protein [Methylococcaceae bacterium]
MKHKTSPFLTAVLCFAFSTCSINVVAEDNDTSLEPASLQQLPSYNDALTLATPLDLKQAISLALERNPDMHITQQRIALANAQVIESLAAFYPLVKGRIGYDYSDNPAQVFGMIVAQRDFQSSDMGNINNPGGRTNFRPEITANLSLFNGGQDYYRYKVAELGVEISELERSSLHNNLIQTVTDNFYALLVAKENQLIAQRSKDAVSRELKNAEIRYKEGTILKSDVLSLQVRQANTEEWLIQATNGIEMAKTGLRTLLDLDTFSPVETLTQDNITLPTAPSSITEALMSAEAKRPEIQMAEKLVSTRTQQVKIAQGEHLPRVGAYLSYGANGQDGSINSNQDNVSTGISLEMDLFSGFGTQQRIKQAERRLEEARLNARKTRLQINQEVKNTYLALAEALQRYKVSATSVTAADEAFRLVTAQFQAGTASVTRYIEAEVARDQADARTIAARFDTLRAYAALQQVTGNWE